MRGHSSSKALGAVAETAGEITSSVGAQLRSAPQRVSGATMTDNPRSDVESSKITVARRLLSEMISPDDTHSMPVEEPYAEDTPLALVFGSNPKVLIVEALLSELDNDITMTDLRQLTGLSRPELDKHVEELQDYDVVDLTCDSGSTPMYHLNTENRAVKRMWELEQDLLEHWYGNEDPVGI